MGACGTIRTNRKYELVASASSVEKGYTDHRCGPPLVACVQKDKRIINFLSNMHTLLFCIYQLASVSTLPTLVVYW